MILNLYIVRTVSQNFIKSLKFYNNLIALIVFFKNVITDYRQSVANEGNRKFSGDYFTASPKLE